jgi:hypothetical protein
MRLSIEIVVGKTEVSFLLISTYISPADRLFSSGIFWIWQWLTTNFWYPVIQFAELLSDCWNIGTNRCRGTRFLSHKQFSHERNVLVAAN